MRQKDRLVARHLNCVVSNSNSGPPCQLQRDSGRDVTWQALKYTAYVSGLTKTQIVDIYQQYFDRYAGGGNAAVRICEFMEVEELEETVLNPGNDQRMIFIAANFRREVLRRVLTAGGKA